MKIPPPHILIVCGAGIVSGKEVMALELADGIAQSGHSFSCVTSVWGNGDFRNRLERLGFPFHPLPIGFIGATLTTECLRMTAAQVWRWPDLIRGYARILRRHRPRKVIHTNWEHLLLLLPFLRADRDLFWLHEIIPDLPQYRRVFGWIERRLDCFVCVSHAVARSLLQIGISEAKIQIIHNGLRDPFVPTNVASDARGSFRIGIVGQIGPWKGHDDLLEAFALVRPKYSTAELHIFGAGDTVYQSGLARKAVELRVADRVKWHGFVADRAAIYANLDVCVVASRFPDPLPTSAIEAGFFGMPVIATRHGGLPEIVEHEVNGLLVEAERPSEIALSLCRLIEDPSLRQSLAINARQSAIARFGAERFLRDFLGLLDIGNYKSPGIRLVS